MNTVKEMLLVGCLLLGFFYGMADRTMLMSNGVKLFLTVGLCGGFTTFSTFCNESVNLFRTDNALWALFYIGGSVFLGLIAVVAGVSAAKLF